MLFRPRWVRVWIETGKREVNAQSPWLQLAATVFRSTNFGGGSGKAPLSLSLIFPSFNFLNKKEDFLIFCIVLGFIFLLIKKLNSLLYLEKK